MRLFLTVLLGGCLSFGLGFALVYAASEWLPCFDDRMSCRMGEAYGIIATIVYAPVATLLFGVTVWRAPSERAIAIAMAALLVPVIGILAIGIMMTGAHFDLARDGQGLLQFYVPLTLIVIVQWAIMRAYLRRKAAA
jgi:hypothetical protein